MTQETTPPLERIGRYQVLEKLGQGGMGAVFLAHDEQLDRRVAIKVLPSESVHDAGAVARFRREARALAQLSHPGIIQCYDSETDAGRHFLVMEFVEGTSLDKVLREQGKVSPALAADYVYQAAQAMQHAHARGLIHRDLKPANLLRTPDGRIKVLDLGLARFLQDQIRDAAQTREGSGMGTPDYSAPEQFRDAHNVDQRADIYSLGCTLYHLLAGRVPFPGSSLSEKYEAHQKREPTPLQELCPEAPAGLVLTVQRMMAKRPADRFQTAAELAEALALYVAGSSPSFSQIQTSSQWHVNTLTFHGTRPRRRRALWVIAGLSLVVVAVAIVFVLSGLLPPSGSTTGAVASNSNGGEPPETKPPVIADPDVLTVSKKPEDGGKYRLINEALEHIQPGQTIRIVDDALYPETLMIKGTQHQGITLEATRGATLEIATNRGNLITLRDVDDVVLRGLRLTARGTQLCALVSVSGACRGCVLDGLEFRPAPAGGIFNGVEILATGVDGERGRPNVRIQGCQFHHASTGVTLVGVLFLGEKYGPAQPVRDVLLCENQFVNCDWGATLKGEFHRVQVVGNQFLNCLRAAWQCENLLDPSDKILIANNTAFECSTNLRIWDNAVRTTAVRMHNNLSLRAPYPDALAIDSGGNTATPVGLGDGSVYPRTWSFSHNWREVKVPTPLPGKPDGWIPGGERDVIQESIPGVNRDPKSPDFLRPAKDSSLATAGAGKEDPALPSYVGALPPPGVEPWDWDRTWLAPPPGKLITVSKDAKDGGEHRTLQDALAAAKPWSTIRVLDAETYDGPLELTDPEKHTGIVLEAPKQAVIRLTPQARAAVRIQDVPHVRLRGFAVRGDAGQLDRPFILVRGKAAGVVLEDLNLEGPASGIVLQVIENSSIGPPLVVRRCRITVAGEGVVVSGPSPGGADRGFCQGVFLYDNHIASAFRGIYLTGSLSDVLVAGNLLSGSRTGGIQIEDLAPEGRGVLLVNNTATQCEGGLRVWLNTADAPITRGQAQVRGNLLVDNAAGDAILFLREQSAGSPSPPHAAKVAELWQFEGNWRDQSGARLPLMLPLSPADHMAKGLRFVSTDPKQPGFMQPIEGSPLATGGLGAKGPWLPEYAGAIPPKGVPSWDWNLTWRAILGKSRPQ